MTGNGSFIMKNGSINNNQAYAGGGMRINNGTVLMEAGSISGNTARDSGGGIYSSGSFTIKTGEISGNTAQSSGGGIYTSGTVTIDGGRIANNSVTATLYGGGGIWLSDASAVLTLNAGEITGNTASRGAGVCIDKGTFNLIGGTIANNTGALQGGGVYHNGSAFNMKGGSISGNAASRAGEGVFINSGAFSMEGAARIDTVCLGGITLGIELTGWLAGGDPIAKLDLWGTAAVWAPAANPPVILKRGSTYPPTSTLPLSRFLLGNFIASSGSNIKTPINTVTYELKADGTLGIK
jgi:predicted outer membrane repeat protein